MREQIHTALNSAIKNGDKCRIATLRLMNAAIKDRDIAAKAHGDTVNNKEILEILDKMVKQRKDSIHIYEEAGRLELAEQEHKEMKIILEFMPKQLSGEEIQVACQQAVDNTGASGLRDMGKCMADLKERYPGQMDFCKASSVVKEILR
jgi:uncharacterized protein YqeY